MKTTKIMMAGLVSAICFGSLAFVPASADENTSKAVAWPAPAEAAAQHLVWDMTYGDQAPAEPAPAAAVLTENKDVTDLSMG